MSIRRHVRIRHVVCTAGVVAAALLVAACGTERESAPPLPSALVPVTFDLDGTTTQPQPTPEPPAQPQPEPPAQPEPPTPPDPQPEPPGDDGHGDDQGADEPADSTEPDDGTSVPDDSEPPEGTVPQPAIEPASNDLAPHPSTFSCSTGCILSAGISKALASPDVTVDVVTDVVTDVDVYLIEHEPILIDDEPVLVGLVPHRSSAGATEHHLPVTGLDWSSDYWLILVARSADGGEQAEHSAVQTVAAPTTRLADLGGPSGCATACVTRATLQPAGAATALHVETHTPAHLWFFASTTPFAADDHGNVPGLELGTAVAQSGDLETTAWDTVIDGLPYATDLHVLVVAQDLAGRRAFHHGTYTTHPAPQLRATFRSVTMIDSGDADGVGELSFSWGHGDTVLGATDGRMDVATGATISLPGPPSFVFTHGDAWPSFAVAALEYDPADLIEHCPHLWETMWPGDLDAEYCGYTGNTASAGILLGHTVETLTPCSEFGVDGLAGVGCVRLDSTAPGGGVPALTAVVSVEYV